MSTSVELLGSGKAWAATPPGQPFNEPAWQAWTAKGRADDRRSDLAHGKLVRWIPIAALLVAAALWSQIAPYETAVRFIVAAGATVVMFQALHEKHYAVAAVFGALALLYNPVLPVFSFSDGGRRALVIASVIPFAASLTSLSGRNSRRKHDD
ncbi:MAG: DUF6804 family protein [Bryobacteraceae bacterium]